MRQGQSGVRWLFLLSSTSTLLVAVMVGVGFSTVVVGVLFLIALGGWTVLAARYLLRLSPRWSALTFPVTLSIVTTTVMLIAAELTLRGLGLRATYSEQNGSPVYRSVYEYDNPAWFHLYTPDTDVRLEKTEFTHERRINSIGLTDVEFRDAKDPGEYRILALGDSFTEGVGAGAEETWVKVLERRASYGPDGRHVRTWNAGVSGSDPFMEYVLLRDRLMRYEPDLVLVAVNNSDLTDTVVRGGMERFRPDGSVQAARRPPVDYLYGISYITRHVLHDFLGYTWLLMSPEAHEAALRQAIGVLKEAVAALSELCRDAGVRMVAIVFPHEYEVRAGKYEPPFFPDVVTGQTASTHLEVVDLLQLYQQEGTLTPANSKEFYWELDFHHNARGYALMGETLAGELIRRGILKDKVE